MCDKEIISRLHGIQGWKLVEVEDNESNGVITLKMERERGHIYECSNCGEQYLFCYDHYPARKVEDLPAWGRKTLIEFQQARVFCEICRCVVPESVEWVELYQRQTIRYQRYLATLCDFMPVADVAEISGLSKDTLYRIDKRYLRERKDNFTDEPQVRLLGIDEIAIRKGHKYAAVFYNLELGEVIGLVKGRKQRSVSGFFRNWGKENCKNVEAVCTDLWAPYHNSVKIHLKNAVLVFDKFHVFKYLSDAIDEVRRYEQRQAEEEGKQLLKGCRWIMLKKDLSRKQKRKLQELLEQNENISKAMLLKEAFSAFYESETEEEAEAVLDEWTEQCQESNLSPFKKLAKRLNRWKDGILAYFTHKITNGMSEGINNKIKVIKRRSYGFRDMDYFFLKILRATGFIPTMKEVYP
jgi:transposase